MLEIQIQPLGREDLLEKEMTTHQYACLENSMDRGAWRATVHGVSKSQTRLNDTECFSGGNSSHYSVPFTFFLCPYKSQQIN